jgi:hypothetical protein
MSQAITRKSAARGVAYTIVLLATAYLGYGCASAPTTAVRDSSLPSCRATEVLYCGANGSRAGHGICSCLTQSAARSVVDSL